MKGSDLFVKCLENEAAFMADAYLDRVPLVAITGQATLEKTHKEALLSFLQFGTENYLVEMIISSIRAEVKIHGRENFI